MILWSDLLTCVNDSVANGNTLLTYGNELLTCGQDFLSCGKEIKTCQKTVLCPFHGVITALQF